MNLTTIQNQLPPATVSPSTSAAVATTPATSLKYAPPISYAQTNLKIVNPLQHFLSPTQLNLPLDFAAKLTQITQNNFSSFASVLKNTLQNVSSLLMITPTYANSHSPSLMKLVIPDTTSTFARYCEKLAGIFFTEVCSTPTLDKISLNTFPLRFGEDLRFAQQAEINLNGQQLLSIASDSRTTGQNRVQQAKAGYVYEDQQSTPSPYQRKKPTRKEDHRRPSLLNSLRTRLAEFLVKFALKIASPIA